MLASALGIEALDQVVLVPGVPDRMAAATLPEALLDAAKRHKWSRWDMKPPTLM